MRYLAVVPARSMVHETFCVSVLAEACAAVSSPARAGSSTRHAARRRPARGKVMVVSFSVPAAAAPLVRCDAGPGTDAARFPARDGAGRGDGARARGRV